MRSVRKQLAKIGVRKPFWNNEINYGVAGGGSPTTTTYSVDKQQAFVIRTYVAERRGQDAAHLLAGLVQHRHDGRPDGRQQW